MFNLSCENFIEKYFQSWTVCFFRLTYMNFVCQQPLNYITKFHLFTIVRSFWYPPLAKKGHQLGRESKRNLLFFGTRSPKSDSIIVKLVSKDNLSCPSIVLTKIINQKKFWLSSKLVFAIFCFDLTILLPCLSNFHASKWSHINANSFKWKHAMSFNSIY